MLSHPLKLAYNEGLPVNDFKKLLLVAAAIVVVYYIVSPYQNCKRDTDLGQAFCTETTSW